MSKWIIVYVGTFLAYMYITYKQSNEDISKYFVDFGYAYLMLLTVFCIVKMFVFLIKAKLKDTPLKRELFILFVLTGIISGVQWNYCLNLFQVPIDTFDWWIPMLSNHSSMILCISIIHFIEWEYKHSKQHCMLSCTGQKETPIRVVWLLTLCILFTIVHIPVTVYKLGNVLHHIEGSNITISNYIDFFWSPMMDMFLIWLVLRYILIYSHCTVPLEPRSYFYKKIKFYNVFVILITGFLSGYIFKLLSIYLLWSMSYIGTLIIIATFIGYIFEQSRRNNIDDKFSVLSYSWIWIWGVGVYFFLAYAPFHRLGSLPPF
jgi:hypothetical protein